MKVALISASPERGMPLVEAARAQGYDTRVVHPEAYSDECDVVAFDGYPLAQVIAFVRQMLHEGPKRPRVLAGLAGAETLAVAESNDVIDDAFHEGDAAGFVLRLAMIERGLRNSVATAAADSRLEQANDAIYTIDFEGTFTSANKATESLTGYSRAEIIGMQLARVVIPEDLERVREQMRAKLTGASDSTIFEIGIRRADGERRHLEVSSRLFYENGRAIGIQGIARDITNLREMERKLSRLGAIVESSAFAVIGRDLDGRVNSWNSAAEQTFGWTREEAIGNRMSRLAPREMEPDVTAQFDSLVAGGTIEQESVRLHKDGHVIPIRATAFPVKDESGRVIGTATLVYDVTQEQAAKRALHDSEERYRAAADLSLDAFMILEAVRDPDGKLRDFTVIDMNRAAEGVLNIPRSTAVGQLLCELIPGIRETAVFERYAEVVERGDLADFETAGTLKEFPQKWFHLTVVKLGDGVAVTIRDVTERRAAQDALENAQAQLSAVFESSNDAVLVLDPELRLMSANRAAMAARLEVHGKEPVIGEDTRGWVVPSGRAEYEATCRQALEGKRVSIEWRRTTLDGREAWIEYSYSAVKSPAGDAIGIAIVGRDVTERRRMAQELAEREAALSAVFASMDEAITLIDPEMRFILGNQLATDRAKKFSGNQPRAGGDMHDYVRPVDWESFEDVFSRALAGEHVTISGRFDDPITGEPAWTEYSYHPVQDEAGEIVAVARVSRDVTKTKKAERALRDANKNHRAIVENTPDALFVLDVGSTPDGQEFTVAMVNSSFSTLTGLPEAYVQGRRIDEVFKDEFVRTAALKRYRQAIDARRTIEYEEVVPYGGRPHIQTNLTPLFDAEGRCYRLIGSSRDITEKLKLAEEERRAREEAERLATIVESASDAILSLNMDRKVTYWSPGAERVYGFKAEEVVGRSIEAIYPWESNNEAAATAHSRLDRVYLGEAIIGSPTQRRHKDGRTLDMVISAFPLRDASGTITGVASTATDVTERLRAEAAVREGAADLDAVFASSKDTLVLLDTAGTIVRMNPAARRDFKIVHGAADMIGRDWRTVMPAEGRPDFDEHFAAACRGEEVSFERQTRIGGEPRWFDVSFSAVRITRDTLRGVLITGRDITERKRTTEALLQAQKLESLAVLAGGIAHDFNNLLVGILGNAGLALSELSPNSPARETVEAIEMAGQRAAELARQMLAYSGRGKLVVQDADINDLVEEMTHLLRVSIGKRASLRLNLGGGLPLVKADATQLRQVIMNLVVNASDAIGDAEGVISISTSTIEASRELLADSYLAPDLAPGRYAMVEVADTGIGMDQDTLARIFDPFFTTKFTGRGLGLAAVLGIMRGHAGAIKVDSVPGEGTTFRLLLPATKSESSTVTPKEAATAWRGSGTVLVIDDEPTVRAVTVRALRAFGFETLEAEDGAAGLEAFQANRDAVVAVLLDMTMPRMNGEDTFIEIKRIEPDARIILMSGYTEQDATERFSGRGLSGFIQKPYELATLRSTLEAALGQAQP